LTGSQATAFGIADNRSAELAEWDEKLADVLASLKAEDFPLEEIGFDLDELEALKPELKSDADSEPQIDKAEELRAKWGVELGQVWQLGEHRITCGDSTSAEVVKRLLGDEMPHLMVTDPPYGVEYDASWRQEAGVAGSGAATGKVLNDDRADWTEAWQLFEGDVCYVWHADRFSPVVARSLETSKFQMRALIIWGKNQHTFGRGDYHSQHEPCWYAVRKGATGHYNGDRTQSTLWEIDKPQKSETGHSTQKPIECMERPIRNNSKPGELIYEPFSGSDTTIIACERTGRKCRAIELNPAYVAVAIQRWADATGKEPRKL
jgi:DNA modification methylase